MVCRSTPKLLLKAALANTSFDPSTFRAYSAKQFEIIHMDVRVLSLLMLSMDAGCAVYLFCLWSE